jgi:hypothetical protein
MLFTVSFNFTKEEVLAIGKAVDPKASAFGIVQSPTMYVTEWIKTTVKNQVEELTGNNAHTGTDRRETE